MEKLKNINPLYFALLIGGITFILTVIFRYFIIIFPNTTNIEQSAVQIFIGLLAAMIRPQKFWLWGMATGLFLPVLYIYRLIESPEFAGMGLEILLYGIELIFIIPMILIPGMLGALVGWGMSRLYRFAVNTGS